MQPASIIRHHVIFTMILSHDFLLWYFVERPMRIIRTYLTYFRAFNEIFSFLFLVRTLFSPWRQIIDTYPGRGFDIGQIAQTFTLNCTTRVIGFLFRFVMLLIGIIAQTALLALFLTFFVVWLTFPILVVTGVSYVFAVVFS